MGFAPPKAQSAGENLFDYDFNMIYLMVMIMNSRNHGHQINHIEIIVNKRGHKATEIHFNPHYPPDPRPNNPTPTNPRPSHFQIHRPCNQQGFFLLYQPK
jgi:hypothetical protein